MTEKENRKVLAGMLKMAGCEVASAESGAAGLALARQNKPDIVFLDLLMPSMDGIATARALLSDPRAGRPKIVANTASALSSRREEAYGAGCVDFIAKPIAAEQVQECLSAHLGVELERAPMQEPALDALAPWEGQTVRLPEELCARLMTAAEFHSATALKSCLKELRQLEPEAGRLAEHIRHLMRSYDMRAIQRLLTQAVTIDTCSPASPPLMDLSSPNAASPERLLLVDDTPANLSVLAATLEPRGFEIWRQAAPRYPASGRHRCGCDRWVGRAR